MYVCICVCNEGVCYTLNCAQSSNAQRNGRKFHKSVEFSITLALDWEKHLKCFIYVSLQTMYMNYAKTEGVGTLMLH